MVGACLSGRGERFNQIEFNRDLLVPGRSTREIAESAWTIPDRFVANRYGVDARPALYSWWKSLRAMEKDVNRQKPRLDPRQIAHHLVDAGIGGDGVIGLDGALGVSLAGQRCRQLKVGQSGIARGSAIGELGEDFLRSRSVAALGSTPRCVGSRASTRPGPSPSPTSAAGSPTRAWRSRTSS